MKKGLIIATTLAMALGVGVAVGAHRAEAKVAKAATDTTVYYAVFTDYSVKCNVNRKGDGDDWATYDMSKNGEKTAGLPVYTCTFTDLYDGLGVLQFQLYDGDTWISQVQPISEWTTSSTYNGKLYDGSNWVTYTPDADPECHLVGSFNGWSDDNDEYLLTVDAQDSNHYTISDVELAAEDELKVKDEANNRWYGNWDEVKQSEENVVISEGGTYDLDFYVYAANKVHIVCTKHVVEPDYFVKINGNTTIMENNDEDKPEGVLHQYKLTIQYPYRAREIEFYRDETKITENIGVDPSSEEFINNIVGDASSGFKIYHYGGENSVDVYLKTYQDGGYSIWGTGYAENQFSILGNTLTLDEDFGPEGDYIKQYKTSSPMSFTVKGEEDEKYYFMDWSGIMQAINVEQSEGQNAVTVTGSYFNVHNNCSAVPYIKMKADLSLWLYIGGYQEAHVITIGGNEVPLTKVDDTQYKATGVDLSAGDTVTGYTIEGESHAVTSRAVANNNLTKDMKVLVDVEDADIYFGVSDSTIYISGLPLGGYHILKNGRTFIEMNPTDPFEEYVQYCSIKLEFAVNDTIQFIDCTGTTPEAEGRPCVWTISKINEEGLGDHFEYDSEGGVIKCKTACETAVYMKLKSGLDEIYFGAVAEWVEEVLDFVAGFKTAMQESCSTEASGKKAAVEAAWGAQATAFGQLSDEAKAEIKLGNSSSLEEVQEFADRYSGILSQHYDWELDNFLDWDVAPARNIGNYELTSDNAALIIIVTLASLSVLAFATLLILKKRKHN